MSNLIPQPNRIKILEKKEKIDWLIPQEWLSFVS